MFFRKKENNSNKKWPIIVIFLIFFITIFFNLYSFYWPKADIKILDKNLTVLVADTDDHKYKGWSNREDMGNVDGMMFIYGELSQHTMVMRDMNFPLDIVWGVGIDDEGRECFLNKFGLRKLLTGTYHSCLVKVVDYAPNVDTEIDIPEYALTPYFAKQESTIIFELPSGWAKENDLKIGDIIEIL